MPGGRSTKESLATKKNTRPVEVTAAPAELSNGANGAPPQRLQRLLRLMILVQGRRGATATSLAQSLGVSRRTVFRDLRVLQEAEVPVRSIPGRGYILDPEFQAALQDFGASEMLGLMLLAKVAQALPEQPLLRPAHEAVMKIIARLPSTVRGFYQELLSNVTFSPGAARMDAEVPARFSTLQRCIEERTVCRVRYSPVTPHKPLAGRVHPLHLHFYKHTWYVLGFSEPHDEVRMFNLSRFESLDATDEIFPPMPFSIEEYLSDAWGIIPGYETYDVAVQFTARVTRNVIEINWHYSQKVQMHDDGSCTVRFRVAGIDEIKWWVIGYGDQAHVLEPAELREELAAMSRSMTALYDRPATSTNDSNVRSK